MLLNSMSHEPRVSLHHTKITEADQLPRVLDERHLDDHCRPQAQVEGQPAFVQRSRAFFSYRACRPHRRVSSRGRHTCHADGRVGSLSRQCAAPRYRLAASFCTRVFTRSHGAAVVAAHRPLTIPPATCSPKPSSCPCPFANCLNESSDGDALGSAREDRASYGSARASSLTRDQQTHGEEHRPDHRGTDAHV